MHGRSSRLAAALLTWTGVVLAPPAFAQAPSPDPAPPPAPELAPVPIAPEPTPGPPLYAPAPAPATLPEYPYVPRPPPVPVHAPRFALWTGVRLSVATFGNSFFRNENGQSEVSGNFIKPGLATEVDIGVRLEKRYIPYVTYDRHWSFGGGRRFEGADSSAYAQFFGFGFRYVFGNPDFVAGFTDLSFGRRSVHVSSAGQSYSMSTFEFFRLGLGAEIRLHSRFSFSPQVNISSGVMQGTSGTVTYSAQRQADGLVMPRYREGASIEDSTSYLVFGLGVGAHFDLFGR